MVWLKNGKSNNGRTRHIAIRFFFVADRVNNNEIKLEYLETGNMIADMILTKSLQGELFRKLKDKLLIRYVLTLRGVLMLMFIHLRLKVRHGKFVTRLYIHWMKENYSGKITVVSLYLWKNSASYYVDG